MPPKDAYSLANGAKTVGISQMVIFIVRLTVSSTWPPRLEVEVERAAWCMVYAVLAGKWMIMWLALGYPIANLLLN